MEQKLVFGQIPPQEEEFHRQNKITPELREADNLRKDQKSLGIVQKRFDFTDHQDQPQEGTLEGIIEGNLERTLEPTAPDKKKKIVPLYRKKDGIYMPGDKKKEVPMKCGDCGLFMEWNGKKVHKGGKFICRHCNY